MNLYEVELKRTSYITVVVEATTHVEAENAAFEEVYDGNYGYKDAHWDIVTTLERKNLETNCY